MREAAGKIVTLFGETMGTSWSVRIVASATGLPRGEAGIRAGIRRTLDAVIAEMSNWEADSFISRFNRSPPGAWQEAPAAFLHVLHAGMKVGRDSGGAYDPAIGELVDLWGFGPAGPRPVPSETAIGAIMEHAGFLHVETDVANRRVRRLRPVQLDFSGIAKGFAVDQVVGWLSSLGLRHFLVEIGGELSGHGLKPDGQPWWIDLEIPSGMDLAPLRVALHGLAAATSGDYRRRRGQFAHSIDPRSGHPVQNGIASVTVLHPCCMLADAWATALLVSGPETGMQLGEFHGLAVHMAVRGAPTEYFSTAFRAMLD